MLRILLLLSLTSLGVSAWAVAPAVDPWPLEPGWAIRLEFPESRGSSYLLQYYEGDTYEIAGRETDVVYTDNFGFGLGQHAGFYSRNEEGDLFLHGNLNLVSGEAEVFDPPVLYLDLPLKVGKTWEVDCRLYDNLDLEGEGQRQHLIMKVAAWDTVTTRAGVFPAWNTVCEVIEGDGLGTDWFAPGVGPVRGSAGQGGPLFDMVDLSREGIWGLEGMGAPVSLTFAWQPGVPISVSKFGYRVRQSSSGADTIRAHLEYILEFNRLPTGYLVHMADLDVGGPPLDGAAGGQGIQDLVARLSRAMPDFLISREGFFMGLAGAEAGLEATFEFFEDVLAEANEDESATRETMAALRGIMTPEVYEAMTAEEWNKLVGTWVGIEGETGALFEGTMSVPVPMLQGQEIPLDFQFAVAETCPCEEDGAKDDCVRLVYTSRTDPEAARESVTAIMQSLGGEELEELDFDSLKVTTSIQTVLEPESMRLHRIIYEKAVKLEMAGPDGEAEPGEQIETEWYYFTYPE